jgi:hypothetical protein
LGGANVPIDMPWIRENFSDLVAQRPKGGLLQPDDIAESYWTLHAQPRSAGLTSSICARSWSPGRGKAASRAQILDFADLL